MLFKPLLYFPGVEKGLKRLQKLLYQGKEIHPGMYSGDQGQYAEILA